MARFNNGNKTEEQIREAINALDINAFEDYVSEIIEKPNFENLTIEKEEHKQAPTKEISFLKNAEFISIAIQE